MAALLLLCLAQFLLVLDVAIVNVALPSISADLEFPAEDLQLVATAYTLTFGGLLLLGGRAADLLGRRTVFVAGLSLFTGASLACGLAPSPGALVAARAAQGVGGALVSPAALSLLTTLFAEGPARNRALAVWSALAAGGGAAGLLLGGVLTDLAGWRWVFFVHVPVGVAVVVAALRLLPAGERQHGRVDMAGAVAGTAGLMALVYGLSGGGAVLLLVGAVLLAAFVAIERRAAEPLVPFSLFGLRSLVGANLATFFLSAVILGANFFLTLYFQGVRGYSPLVTGLAFLPLTVASALASGVAARLVGRLGARTLLLAGMAALAAGSLLLSRLSPAGSVLVVVLPGMLLVAVGLGVGFTVGTLAATAGVEARQQGAASGVFNTSQQVGAGIGLAVLAAVAGADGFRVAFLAMAGCALAGALAVAALIREIPAATGAVPAGGTAHTAQCLPAVTQVTRT
jgi:EmrB/QacA subfamily drug resistance transporter